MKVLIAIDYNPCAQKVAETGYAHARAMNGEICIVHSIPDTAYYSMEYSPIMGFKSIGADCAFKNIDEQKIEADSFLTAVAKYLGDNKIKTYVLDGKAAQAILDFAFEWKADLIVMGGQSHNSIEKEIMGGVAASVLKNSDIPILIVPTEKQDLNKVSQKLNLVPQL